MSEERTPREGSSRRSEGAQEAAGGGGAGSAAVPRQSAQSAHGGAGGGGGRRRAAAAEFGAAEFAAALQNSVSAIGVAGPPRAGLARVRRKAKARQRRRTVMAGSAGVLMLAVAVSVVTGNSFDIVPVLTGVVGLGGSHSSSGDGASPQDGGGGQVRTVRPPADAAGKKGPAIGPVGVVAGVPTALAATGVPECTAADLTTATTVDAVIGGVSYGHVEAIAERTCAVAGPPVLQVANMAGTAASSVVILQHVSSDGSQLPAVPTWGAVLKLQPGQGYDFQFAWAPDGCVGTGSATPGTGATTGSGQSPAGSADQASASAYTLSYLIGNASPTEPVDLTAACGATVYVTDIYGRGAYPTAKAPASPSAQPPSSSAPATTPSPTTASPSSTPSTTGSSTAPPSGSATSSSGSGSGGGSGGGSPAGGAPSPSLPTQPTNS
jgi:hypothetical protein